ncbi:hypothetical protein ABPG72_008473 [Tetrahymena utriculariae]
MGDRENSLLRESKEQARTSAIPTFNYQSSAVISFRSGKNYQREADQFKNEKNEEIIVKQNYNIQKQNEKIQPFFKSFLGGNHIYQGFVFRKNFSFCKETNVNAWTQLKQTETSLEGAQLTWSQLWYFLSVVGQLSISGSSQIFEGTSSSLSQSVSNTISLYEMILILCHVLFLLLLFSSFIFMGQLTAGRRKFKNKKFISKMFVLQGMVSDYQDMIPLSSKIGRVCRMEIFSPNIPVQIFESSFRR